MIPTALYLAFLFASIVLLLIPGPNVALIASTSIAHGPRAGLLTVAGTSCAMLLQLAMTVAGMTSLLTVSADGFAVLRWIGVFYLLYLGICAWRAAPDDLTAAAPVKPAMAAMFWRGVLISLTNPKTLLFFGAFLPQFVSPASPLLPQASDSIGKLPRIGCDCRLRMGTAGRTASLGPRNRRTPAQSAAGRALDRRRCGAGLGTQELTMAMAIAFDRDFEAPYEKLIPVSPRIRRLLTANPGPFTFKGDQRRDHRHGSRCGDRSRAGRS